MTALIDIVKARADVLTYHRVKETVESLDRKTMRGIAIRVAAKHNLPMPEIFSKNRRHFVSQVRQEVMWECRAKGYSLGQIGRFLGRDHTTIIHGIRAHEARMGAAK